MILTTPFHERTSALNETGLWNHWAGHLVGQPLPGSDKFEYFAVRNAAGIFDTSPLFKYRIAGADAERFLSGILARDVRACPPQAAQYTTWLDERGFVLEDGVVQRRGADEYLLTSAEPNYSYLADRIGRLRVTIEDVSLRHRGARGPGAALARPAQPPRADGRAGCRSSASRPAPSARGR